MPEEKEYKTYSSAGVDVEKGDECSRIAYQACLDTYGNRKGRFGNPKVFEGGFSGPVKINRSLENAYLVKNSDGVGSKALVAQRMGKHNTLGHDLIAMNADDTASIGAEPFVGTNSLDVSRAEPELVGDLMAGLVEACGRADIAMVGGEIAELPDQVKGYSNPYIWNADLLGVLEEEKLIDGSDIQPNDKIVAVKSNGIRANGLTLAREICCESFGSNWHEEECESGESWGEVLLKPSRIVSPALVDIFGGYGEEANVEVHGVAHITGGGIHNLERVLPGDLGAEITDLYEPQPEFLLLQELGPVSDEEAYSIWNMGQCMLIVTPEADSVMDRLDQADCPSRICGEVTGKGEVTVRTRGKEGTTLSL